MVFSHVHVEVSEVRVHCSSELSKTNVYPIHIAFSFFMYILQIIPHGTFTALLEIKSQGQSIHAIYTLFMPREKEMKPMDILSW